MLGGEAVQPGESIRAADGDDAAMRQVDCPCSPGEAALLRVRVAVVPGHALVRRALAHAVPRAARAAAGEGRAKL